MTVYERLRPGMQRDLYVPYRQEADPDNVGEFKWVTEISWTEQVNKAFYLFGQGYSVRVHRHGLGQSCRPYVAMSEVLDAPDGYCVQVEAGKELREGEPDVRLVPVIEANPTASGSDSPDELTTQSDA